MERRVPWDGPNPGPGDYLATRKQDFAYLIEAVRPLVTRGERSSERLVLDLRRLRARDVPAGAVVHPPQRYAPDNPDGPPRVRQTAKDGDIGAVLVTRWRDPDDMRPNASAKPRQITGYRTWCPLRRMAEMRNSHITERHIAAADQLRLLVDLASIGLTSVSDLEAVHTGFGPSPGPSDAAVAQADAALDVGRAIGLFAPNQHHMLLEIVLKNRSIHAWCINETKRRALARPLDRDVEMGRMLAILDILAEHFKLTIDRRLTEGVP